MKVGLESNYDNEISLLLRAQKSGTGHIFNDLF